MLCFFYPPSTRSYCCTCENDNCSSNSLHLSLSIRKKKRIIITSSSPCEDILLTGRRPLQVQQPRGQTWSPQPKRRLHLQEQLLVSMRWSQRLEQSMMVSRYHWLRARFHCRLGRGQRGPQARWRRPGSTKLQQMWLAQR